MSEARKGRPPAMRAAVMAALEGHQHAPLDAAMLSKMTGRPVGSIRDLLFEYKRDGKCAGVDYYHHMWYFYSAAARDAWVAAHPKGMPKQPVTTKRVDGPSARMPRVLAAVQSAGAAGTTAVGVEKETGITQGNVRDVLYRLEHAGQVWRMGGKHNMTWFASKEFALAAAEAVEAKKRDFAMRRQIEREIRAHKKMTAAKVKKDKPLSSKRRTCSIPSDFARASADARIKAAQDRKPVEIIGMDKAKFTPAVPKPDHRYMVSHEHRGEFSSLGIGRYAE